MRGAARSLTDPERRILRAVCRLSECIEATARERHKAQQVRGGKDVTRRLARELNALYAEKRKLRAEALRLTAPPGSRDDEYGIVRPSPPAELAPSPPAELTTHPQVRNIADEATRHDAKRVHWTFWSYAQRELPRAWATWQHDKPTRDTIARWVREKSTAAIEPVERLLLDADLSLEAIPEGRGFLLLQRTRPRRQRSTVSDLREAA